MTTIPEQIAAGLSEAEVIALIAFTHPGYSLAIPQSQAGKLVALGLLSGPGRITHPSQRGLPPEYIITPLGEQVRAIIKDQPNDQ